MKKNKSSIFAVLFAGVLLVLSLYLPSMAYNSKSVGIAFSDPDLDSLAVDNGAIFNGTTTVNGVANFTSTFKLLGSAVNSTAAELNMVHGLDSSGPGIIEQVATASIARTDTSTKSLFVLPANAIPVSLEVVGAAVSNAGTAASISVGISSNNDYFLPTLDVKGTTGVNVQTPAASNTIGVTVGASSVTVDGLYTESGAASSAGGPWEVILGYRAK